MVEVGLELELIRRTDTPGTPALPVKLELVTVTIMGVVPLVPDWPEIEAR
jgi:hypothetical protein